LERKNCEAPVIKFSSSPASSSLSDSNILHLTFYIFSKGKRYFTSISNNRFRTQQITTGVPTLIKQHLFFGHC
jgi:hypothetical protein